jgi:hypothetical protein
MTPEEILEKNRIHNRWYLSALLERDILTAMKEFGQQCFFAAKYGEFVSFESTVEFETFEDYLKELYETNNK